MTIRRDEFYVKGGRESMRKADLRIR